MSGPSVSSRREFSAHSDDYPPVAFISSLSRDSTDRAGFGRVGRIKQRFDTLVRAATNPLYWFCSNENPTRGVSCLKTKTFSKDQIQSRLKRPIYGRASPYFGGGLTRERLQCSPGVWPIIHRKGFPPVPSWPLLLRTRRQRAKTRIEAFLGERASGVWAMTFHSACARILRAELPGLKASGRFTIMDSDDQVKLPCVKC